LLVEFEIDNTNFKARITQIRKRIVKSNLV